MTRIQNILMPYQTFAEGDEPDTPAAGTVVTWFDTTDQLLKLKNSAGDVSIVGAGASGLTLLEQHTAADSASLNFTDFISATYDEYVIEILNLLPQTDAVNLLCKLSTDGGSTWLASTGYRFTLSYANTNNAGAVSGGSGGTSAWSLGLNLDNSAAGGFCGTYRFFSPAAGVGNPNCMIIGSGYGLTNDSGFDYLRTIGGRHTGTTAINALQLIMSSGNIVSGIARVYGVAK